MSYDKIKAYFKEIGLGDRVRLLEESSATVGLAAAAVGCEEKQIAKSLSFFADDLPILVVAAGNAKIDNKKYKAVFGQKAKMIPWDQVQSHIGHEPGGVCPFLINPGVKVYLDVSLKQNEMVYPAAGSDNSVVKLSLEELERYSAYTSWVDITKLP